MRVLIFHGYLLRGTGSNIYNASLADALVGLGHEVHLLCQDRAAAELPFVDAVGRWGEGRLRVEVLREPVRCTVYTPDIGRLLPVYVADRYEGFDARPFGALSRDELDRYLSANVGAVAEVASRAGPAVALANHAVMGPAILARAIGGRVPYAVKIHGSALEYTVAIEPERFLPFAREGLEAAAGVLVGSGHIARRLWSVVSDADLPEKTRLGPPGVDVQRFRPRASGEARAGLAALGDRLEGSTASWGGEPGAGAALRLLAEGDGPIVSYVGKLIVSKGVDLLIAAWPLVVAAVPQARLCVIGFGELREPLGRVVAGLGARDLGPIRELARVGRRLEGGPEAGLAYLAAFLEGLQGPDQQEYLDAAGRAAGRIHFTGRLEHADLPEVLAACKAHVVPSTFPEAFGMVAAEAAACGALPISAAHSGLAEVSATLGSGLDPALRGLLSFPLGPGAVLELAGRLTRWLTLGADERARASAALAELARSRYGWQGVAEGVIAAAEGRLADLPEAGASDAGEGAG